MGNEDQGVGRETLEETRGRTAKFLAAIGTNRAIRAAMTSIGYTDAAHAKGWSLLHAASGYAPAEATPVLDTAARDALTTLDNEDEDLFRVARATLTHNFPSQAAKVLEGIGPTSGGKCVPNVRKLVERVRALATSSGDADKAAAAELGNRKLGDAELTRLEALLASAEKAAAVVPVDTSAADAADEKHLGALRALRAWYEEWSEMARAGVKRRDHLIQLGLAKRKSPKKGDKGDA